MCNKPLVNAIVDVIFNEDEIRSTAYQPATPDQEDRKVYWIIYISFKFHVFLNKMKSSVEIKKWRVHYIIAINKNQLLKTAPFLLTNWENTTR